MINVRMQQKEVKKLSPKITVIGVGGAGGNAVNNMISSGLQGCEFVVCNTDAQALDGSMSDVKVQLGTMVTGGLGAGAKPEIGSAAAEESLEEVTQYLEGSNMAFITCGMGGGTGTGAAPVIAKACRELGVLTVGVVTKPFHFEGTHRMRQAEAGIEEMQQYVDTLIVIPNQNLFRVANEKTTFAEAFKMADSVLQSGVRGVTDLMVMPGLINLDFADIRSAMLEMGKAMMGTGDAEGERRAIEAAEAAINNPLLDDVSMKGARGVIINVTGGMDMTLFEVDEACNRIRDEVDPNANIIFGSTFDENLEGVMRVSVVATGIDAEPVTKAKPSGSRINVLTGQQQQERKLERTTPKTEAASMSTSVSASVPASMVSENKQEDKPSSMMSGTPASAPMKTEAASVSASPMSGQANIPSRGPVTASAMSYAAAIAATKKPEEPEGDMFEHHALEAGNLALAEPQRVVEPNEAPMQQQGQQVRQNVQQPQQQQQSSPATSGALRGSVYNDAFIPPQPVEPERQESGYGPDLGMGQLSAPKRVNVEPPAQTVTSSGLTLKPPVPGGGAHRKKTPSLFERFTNPLRPGHREDDQQGESGRGSSSAGGAGGMNLRAPQRDQREMQQGSLNIDAPKTDNAEDELDIPAFLRRQAN